MSSGRITLLPGLGVKAMQLFVKPSKIRMGELVSLIHCSAAPDSTLGAWVPSEQACRAGRAAGCSFTFC